MEIWKLLLLLWAIVAGMWLVKTFNETNRRKEREEAAKRRTGAA